MHRTSKQYKKKGAVKFIKRKNKMAREAEYKLTSHDMAPWNKDEAKLKRNESIHSE